MEEQVDLLYRAYPKRVAKGDARKAITKALQRVEFEILLDAVDEYARACKSSGIEKAFIPYPATWFNQERWEDDRSEWWRSARSAPAQKTLAEKLPTEEDLKNYSPY
jgi:hypothetical protein